MTLDASGTMKKLIFGNKQVIHAYIVAYKNRI